MSCPDEPTLLLYADGELEAEALRRFESHLVRCRDCRARVVALRDEATLLADVLLDRRRGSHAPRRAAAPEPGLAIGLPAAIAVVTLGLAVLGFLLDARLPGVLDLLDPRRLKGVTEMAFDLVFLLRDQAPGLIELLLSLGAVASFSALATFGVGIVYRRVFGSTAVLLLALGIAAGAPAPAHALRVAFDTDTRVAAGETVDESMLLSGERLHLDGVVVGDVVATAERISVGGTIDGNLYAFCRELEILGEVKGSVHAIAEDVRIEGQVDGMVHVAGERVVLADGAKTSRDVAIAAESAVIEGTVGRDLVFTGPQLELRAKIERNVDIFWARSVTLLDGARVGGDIDAGLEKEDGLDVAPGAVVGGEVRTRALGGMEQGYLAHYLEPSFYLIHAIGFAAAFVFGLLLHVFVPRLLETGMPSTRSFFRALLLGFIGVVVTPIAIVLIAITVVGLPAAILLLFLYFTTFYTATILVGALIGQALTPPSDETTMAFGRSLFVGLGLLVIASHLPFVGPPIGIVATLFGFGLLAEKIRFHPAFAGS